MKIMDKCQACKELLEWANTDTTDIARCGNDYMYMEDEVYVVKDCGMAVIVRAKNPQEAVTKARMRMRVNQYGDNNTCIHNVGTLTIK